MEVTNLAFWNYQINRWPRFRVVVRSRQALEKETRRLDDTLASRRPRKRLQVGVSATYVLATIPRAVVSLLTLSLDNLRSPPGVSQRAKVPPVHGKVGAAEERCLWLSHGYSRVCEFLQCASETLRCARCGISSRMPVQLPVRYR